MLNQEESYWTTRYKEHSTGWDIGYPSTPIKSYIDQLEDKNIKLLIPGAGNGYEAEYLIEKGFTNVHILDISEIPLQDFKKRNPSFPDSHLHHANFFEFEGQFDIIIEQTFFCSFVPTAENRSTYAQQMASLLKEKGKLVGLWFSIPLTDNLEKRPFGGDKKLYLSYLDPFFTEKTFQPCYNSILPRQNRELFGIFIKE